MKSPSGMRKTGLRGRIPASFGGYSYSKATNASGVAVGWQDVFKSRLNTWRRIGALYEPIRRFCAGLRTDGKEACFRRRGRLHRGVDGGAEFTNYQDLNSSMEARRAEKEGVTSLYSALVDKAVPIEYNDVFKDKTTGRRTA